MKFLAKSLRSGKLVQKFSNIAVALLFVKLVLFKNLKISGLGLASSKLKD